MSYNPNFHHPPPGYGQQQTIPPSTISARPPPRYPPPPQQRYSSQTSSGHQHYHHLPPTHFPPSNYCNPPPRCPPVPSSSTFPYSNPPPIGQLRKSSTPSITLNQPAIPGCTSSSPSTSILTNQPPPPGFSSPPPLPNDWNQSETKIESHDSLKSKISYDFPPPTFNIPPPSIRNFNFSLPPPPQPSLTPPINYPHPPYPFPSKPGMQHTFSRPPPTIPSTNYRQPSYAAGKQIRTTLPSTSSSNRSNRSAKDYKNQPLSERDKLLYKWRSNYCETSDDIARKLAELENHEDKEYWIRSSPADMYYTRNADNMLATSKLDALCTLFEQELIKRGETIRAAQKPYDPEPKKRKHKVHHCRAEKCSSSESSDDDEFELKEDCSMEELTKKINHPYRLHADLWHNEAGEMNDGPLCRCSAKSRRSGIRHGIYPGEKDIPRCDLNSNNFNKLHHYRITISPPTNFLTKTPTIIKYDQHEFLFEGFSMLTHVPIGQLPTCKVIRFHIEYTILYIEEKMPENFTIRDLDLFHKYLFDELLEMLDFDLIPSNSTAGETCSCFHFLPRFVRDLPDNGKEVLAMSEVLRYLLDSSGPLVPRSTLETMMTLQQNDWQDYVDTIKDMVVTNPGMKPCSVRVDQLDRNVSDLPECIDPDDPQIIHPVIVHFGIRPPQLSYAGTLEYQKAWREYAKFRHLIANMSKPSYDDKRKLEYKENRLQEIRCQGRMKRNITVAITSKGFYRTGIMCDIVQHAMLLPVLTSHLRFHWSLDILEQEIDYTFQNRYILQLALTHPSFKEHFGTNPDHARNSLTNCGIRQPEYGDRKIHYLNTRKRGINTLINIMSRFGKEYETDSNISHNERLEFLGDAVVEFLTSIHLFFMFPELEEGGLATYRAAIVQNQHLAVLAKKLNLDDYMLYAHGSDLCHELELRHAMANCFEALMGALLLDGGINIADKVFGSALFQNEEPLKDVWENIPSHPLQEQEPLGDRQWIESYPFLKELSKFEESVGYQFKHIRLLARAFTDCSIGFTHLTLGSNQRLEFLGDTVLQLICSEYLYRHFPEHHEGHLSLLRSSLVNNRTQAVVCDDLGMTQYARYSSPRGDLKTKDRADLLEAFLGALYVDRGLEPCQVFCQVCLFPRLQMFIMNQDWNDPKSKLQQCCLTLRTMDGGEPDIPVYKVIECIGPTNTRVYTVAVYFRGKRLACATGHSIQQAEMNAAKAALQNSRELFPQLDHQKRVITESIKRQRVQNNRDGSHHQHHHNHQINRNANADKTNQLMIDKYNKLVDQTFNNDDESNLPKQYRSREDISSSDEFDIISDTDSLESIDNVIDQRKKRNKSKNYKRTRNNSDSSSNISSVTSSILTDGISTAVAGNVKTNLATQLNTNSIICDDNFSSISDDVDDDEEKKDYENVSDNNLNFSNHKDVSSLENIESNENESDDSVESGEIFDQDEL